MSAEPNYQEPITGKFGKDTETQPQQEGQVKGTESGKKKGGKKKMRKAIKKNENLKADLRIEKYKRKNDRKLFAEQLAHQKDKGKLEAYEEIFGSVKRCLQQEHLCLPAARKPKDSSRSIDFSKVIDVKQYSVEDSE